MKTAFIYEFKDRLIFVPEHRTTKRANLQGSPTKTLTSRSPVDLRNAVLDVLHCSGAVVPHPTTWKGIFDPILKAAGVRSSVKFYQSAKCVVVEQHRDGGLEFKPLRNVSSRLGFVSMDVRIPATTTDSGDMLLLALAEAR
jgi:hypothetical protein